MSKYQELYYYLDNNKGSYLKLSFNEIERIISGGLPESAVKYKERWANGGHIQANAWLDAGWHVRNVILGEYVEFIRKNIIDYQVKCFKEYKSKIGLQDDYCFYYGNPVEAVVPMDTVVKSIMIIGAYPSAKFGTINGIADVPLYNLNSPFSSKQSLTWLSEEIEIAQPKVIFIMGAELTSLLFDISKPKAITYLDGKIREFSLSETINKAICFPHPGIVMRPQSEKNTWPERLKNEIIPTAKRELRESGIISSEIPTIDMDFEFEDFIHRTGKYKYIRDDGE